MIKIIDNSAHSTVFITSKKVEWFSWKQYFEQYFTIPAIRKLSEGHLFSFCIASKAILRMRKASIFVEKDCFSLLKRHTLVSTTLDSFSREDLTVRISYERLWAPFHHQKKGTEGSTWKLMYLTCTILATPRLRSDILGQRQRALQSSHAVIKRFFTSLEWKTASTNRKEYEIHHSLL